MWPLQRRTKRLPPWRWLPGWLVPPTRETAIHNQVRLTRIIGAVFAIFGALILIIAVIGLIARIA